MSYLGHEVDGLFDPPSEIYAASLRLATERNPSVILDLGARHGEGYARLGAHFPDARYIFVEPSERCAERIRDTIRRYPDRDLQLISGVLGAQAARRKFATFENDDDMAGNMFSDRAGVYGECEVTEVLVFPFDALGTSEIDFAKINIEGGEFELADQGFFDRVGAFVMEAHNSHVEGKTYRDILDSLEPTFDLVTYRDLDYKYCFIAGTRVSP